MADGVMEVKQGLGSEAGPVDRAEEGSDARTLAIGQPLNSIRIAEPDRAAMPAPEPR